MPGPNSAPNGDVRLVKGNPRQRFTLVKYTEDGVKLQKWVPLRDYLAVRNRLYTGKTRA